MRRSAVVCPRSLVHRTLPAIALSWMLTSAPAGAIETAPPPPKMGLYRPHLQLDVDRCVSPDDRERAERAAKPEAFSSDVGIYLPPLYWASRDRTFEQILLMYWKNIDVEDGARFDLLFPLFARLCAPENDTVIAPLGLAGWRTDELGTAGYVGPYFFRRDADAETDTVFPIFWWVRDADGSTLIAGPWFDVDTKDWHVFGLAPLYLGVEGPRKYFEISPLHLRWGNDEEDNGFALQTYWSVGPGDNWSVISAPFYAGGNDVEMRRSWHIIPPLLFGAWARNDESTLIAGPYVDHQTPRAHDRAFIPVFAMGDGNDADASLIGDLLLGNESFAGPSLDGAPFHYHLVPPLLYAHAGIETPAGDVERTFFATSYLWRSPSGYDAGLFPLYMTGRSPVSGSDARAFSYDIVPPLAFARWSNDGEHNLLFAQTWATWRAPVGDARLDADVDDWTLASVPFVWAGRDDAKHHLVIPPLAFAAWGEEGVEESLLMGPWLDVDRVTPAGKPGGHDTAILPLALIGRVDDGGEAAWMSRPIEGALQLALGRSRHSGEPLRHVLIPPLLFGHVSDDDTGRTWWLQSYLATSSSGWDFASLPFYLGGRETQRAGGLSYDVVPPLLLARWGENGEENLWFAQTYAHWEDAGWWFLSFPLAVGGGDHEQSFALAPLLLFGHLGGDLFGAQRSFTHLGPWWLWSSPAGWDLGAFPFYVGGRETQRSDGLAYDFALPLLFARWSDDDETFLWLAQTFASWDARRWSVASLPLFFGAQEPNGDNHFIIPPLLFGAWGTLASRGERGFVVGPWWDLERSGGSRELALMPFFLDGDARYEDWRPDDGVVPSAGTGLTHLLRPTLAGILGRETSSLEPLHFRLIPPLLYAHVGGPAPPRADGTADGDVERTWLLQSYFSSTPSGWDLGIAPLYFGGRETQRPDDGLAYDVIPPLLFARWSEHDASSLWLAQTFAHWDPEAWWVASVPFVFGGGDAVSGAHHFVIPPLLLAIWGDEAGENFVAGPWVDIATDDARDRAFIPLYLDGETAAPASGDAGDWGTWMSRALRPALQLSLGRAAASTAALHHRLLLPLLYAHVGDGETERTWFAQSYFARSSAGWDLGVAPLYFGGRETQRADGDGLSYDVVPPLLFARWADEGEHQALFAQTLAHWNEDEWWLASLPLAFAGGNRGGDHHLVVPPLLFAWWGDGASEREYAHFLTGYLWSSPAGWDAGVFPLYAGGRETQRSDAEGAFAYDAVPLLLFARWSEDREGSWLWGTSYLHVDDDAWWLASFPLGFAGGNERGGAHAIIPPLTLLWLSDADSTVAHLATAWFWSSPAGWDAGIFPLWMSGRETQRPADGLAYDVVLPLLFARWADERAHWLWFAQTFAQWSETGAQPWSIASVPLLFAGDDDGAGPRHHLIIPPLAFGTWGDGVDESLVVGPWLDFKRGDARELALLPLFLDGTKGAQGEPAGPIAAGFGLEDGLRALLNSEPQAPLHYRAIPLVYAHAGDGVTEQTVFLQSWLRRSSRPGAERIDVGSFPLYFGGWNPAPEGAGDDGGDGSYHVIPPLLFATWADGQGTRDVIAGPVWWTGRPTSWSAWAAPFYFGADGERDKRPWYHVVPPLLFASWGDEFQQTSTTVQLPLYLRHESMRNGRRAFVDAKTPLWWTWGDDREWRSLFLPTLTYTSFVDDEDWLLAPFVWRRADATSSDFIVFPFWWDFRGKDLEATVVSGLWWDFSWKSDGERLQVAPGYLRWEDKVETLTIAGPVTWTDGKDGDAWSFHVFPFYSSWSFHKEHIKWRVLFGALGYERERAVEQWQILWIKTQPR